MRPSPAILAILICGVLVAGAAGCGSPEPPPGGRDAPGPAAIRIDLVERHAAQFEEEIPERPAGSQQEEAASTYLFGHLARSGYETLLDGVPVANLVRSTNIIAFPPGGRDPAVVVAVAYDTRPDAASGGLALGLFLEAARALMVAEPDHAVMFVALGAEHAAAQGGRLGSRRLARFLLDRDQTPQVIVIGEIEPTGDVRFMSGDEAPAGDSVEVFEAAGFRSASISGGVLAVGPALLDRLRSIGS